MTRPLCGPEEFGWTVYLRALDGRTVFDSRELARRAQVLSRLACPKNLALREAHRDLAEQLTSDPNRLDGLFISTSGWHDGV